MEALVRDITKDSDYYTQAIQKRNANIADLLNNIQTRTHDNTAALCGWLQAEHVAVADLMFCRGDEMKSIVPVFEKALELQTLKMHHYRIWRKSLQVVKDEITDDFPEFKRAYASSATIEQYFDILLKLSRSILLNIDNDLFKKYTWDVTRPGVDYIFDKLIHYKLPEWPVKGKLHYPKKFNNLQLALQSDNEQERITYLTNYMSGWMKKMRGNSLFGPHMLKDYNYTGYWCFEVSAIAHITHTSTEKLKEMKYFPKDFGHDE